MTQDYLYESRGETQDSKRTHSSSSHSARSNIARNERNALARVGREAENERLATIQETKDAALFAYKAPLTEQEVQFLEVLFTTADPKRAMREAGYGGTTHISSVMSKPNIKQAIHERARYENVGIPQVLEMIGQLARADVQDLHTIEEWDEREETVDDEGVKHVTVTHHRKAVPDLVKAIESGNSYIIKGIKYNRDGSIKDFTIEDRAPYIDKLCEILGLTNKSGINKRDLRSYQEKLRDSGLDPKTIVEELEALTRELREQHIPDVYDASMANPQ